MYFGGDAAVGHKVMAHGHVRTWLKWIGLKEVKDLRGQSLGNSHMNAEAAKKSAGSSDREKDVGP